MLLLNIGFITLLFSVSCILSDMLDELQEHVESIDMANGKSILE